MIDMDIKILFKLLSKNSNLNSNYKINKFKFLYK